MDGIYLEVEDGRVVWFTTGRKGMPAGPIVDTPNAPTALNLTEGTV